MCDETLPGYQETGYRETLSDPGDRAAEFGYEEALQFLYGRIDYERATGSRDNHEFRLERTQRLFENLGLGDYLFRGAGPSAHDCNSTASEDAASQDAASEDAASQDAASQDAASQDALSQTADGSELAQPPGSVSPKIPLVHIAGTKGKGSTATMLSSILTASGYRVGLYTSPHLTDLEERFRIDGIPCDRETLVDLVRSVAPEVRKLDATGNPVSFFELTTAMAVFLFDRSHCDVIILEVGLGGRLDSTNVCASTIAAITSIGLDHQRVLGNTIAKIASEKAGIIKGAVPVISGVTAPEAAEVIRQAAARSGSRLYELGTDYEVRSAQEADVGSRFTYQAMSPDLTMNQVGAAQNDHAECRSSKKEGWAENDRWGLPISLSLDGVHQVHNAAIAISIARRLAGLLPGDGGDGTGEKRAGGKEVCDEATALALRTVRCGGRMERFKLEDTESTRGAIQIILDTAHNEDSIAALCESVSRRTGNHGDGQDGRFRKPIVVVCAVSRDKDVAAITSALATISDRILCTRFTTNPRSLTAAQLASAFMPHLAAESEVSLESIDDPVTAMEKAIAAADPGGTVIVCGSFFLAGELRPRLLQMPKLKPLDTEIGVATLGVVSAVDDRLSGTAAEA